MSRRLPHTEMTPSEWLAFCTWLDSQRGKAGYRDSFPYQWQWLCVMGSPEAAEARRLANWPIFYWEGKGWCLKRDWRERIEAPPGSYVLDEQNRRTVPGPVQAEQRAKREAKP